MSKGNKSMDYFYQNGAEFGNSCGYLNDYALLDIGQQIMRDEIDLIQEIKNEGSVQGTLK